MCSVLYPHECNRHFLFPLFPGSRTQYRGGGGGGGVNALSAHLAVLITEAITAATDTRHSSQ